MAVLEHPDMPKSIGGIQGLNPWNFLMLNVLLAWRRNRKYEGLRWDMPRHVSVLATLYLFVILWGFARLLMDLGNLKNDEMEDIGMVSAVSELLINCLKWVLPGILLFDACRSRQRTVIAVVCILGVYFLLALQVIKHMPLSLVATDGAELSRRANKILISLVGYNRVNLSMMFSGASWAALTVLALVRRPRSKILIIGCAVAIALAQALTGGR
ncbi:MAG TPA: O-antigen ligase domain-containing protein, partial [Verrucomicrobiae bacterium]